MTVDLRPTTLDNLRETLSRHLGSLPSAFDSFVEGHILASAHYDVLLSGVASVHQGSLVTQFSLEPQARPYGQDVFA